MAGYGLFLLGLVLILSILFPTPLGQPGVAGAEVTKPWWMFIWLFPAEEAWGARALVIVPLALGILLAVPALVSVYVGHDLAFLELRYQVKGGDTDGKRPRLRDGC